MRIHDNSMTGDAGIALIHTRVSQMGFVWTARHLEAGIDGQIEIRDDQTGEVKNCVVHVQSKAVEKHFLGDTEDRVEFRFEEKHIDYWMGGNAPVIVVVSRPSTDEAYWKDVRAWFRNAANRASRKVSFDRKKDVFDRTARRALIELAEPQDAGHYFEPEPLAETLVSNLVEVWVRADCVFYAQTPVDSEWQFDQVVGATPDRALWAVRRDTVISFEDLNDPRFARVVEQGTVERHDLEYWSDTDDPSDRNLFVQLLNRALRAHLHRHDVRYDFDRKLFLFVPNDGLKSRDWSYAMIKEEASRKVFERRIRDGRTSWCRHSAFVPHFLRAEGRWMLEIVPTYVFTTDGVEGHPKTAKLMKKIKAIEKNKALLGQVYMWADVLSRNEGLFEEEEGVLQFGRPLEFRLDVGLRDDQWIANDETEQETDAAARGLFE